MSLLLPVIISQIMVLSLLFHVLLIQVTALSLSIWEEKLKDCALYEALVRYPKCSDSRHRGNGVADPVYLCWFLLFFSARLASQGLLPLQTDCRGTESHILT